MFTDDIIMQKNYEYFVSALNRRVKGAKDSSGEKIDQNTIADIVSCSPVHLSGIINGKRNASPDLQERLANYFGMSISEFIELGKIIKEGHAEPPDTIQLHKIQDRRTENGSDVVSKLSNITIEFVQMQSDLRKAKAEAARWRGIIESVGDGVAVIEAGTKNIIFQNGAHKKLFGDIIGKRCSEVALCRAGNDKCLSDMVFEDGKVHHRTIEIDGALIATTVSPIINNGVITHVVGTAKKVEPGGGL